MKTFFSLFLLFFLSQDKKPETSGNDLSETTKKLFRSLKLQLKYVTGTENVMP